MPNAEVKPIKLPSRHACVERIGLPAHEVVLLLGNDPQRGLSDDEAADRLKTFGPNACPQYRGAGLLIRILRQFHHPLIYVLLFAGVITAALGEFIDSAVIFAVVLVNAIVGFIQESRAEAALEGLRSMVRTDAKVVRSGRDRILPSEEPSPVTWCCWRPATRCRRISDSCGTPSSPSTSPLSLVSRNRSTRARPSSRGTVSSPTGPISPTPERW